ncbi:MAG: hypothetical protein NC210_06125 [[Clostridium] fimetarium]|nr:hypothetical protein [Alistipes timonensis]MCM1405980.1 hypothetical protein [[Clostridium] fimetarium]
MKKILLSAAAVAVSVFAASAYEHTNPKINEVYPQAVDAEGELAPDNFKSATATSIPKIMRNPTNTTPYNATPYIIRDWFIKGEESYENGVIVTHGPHSNNDEATREQVLGAFHMVNFGSECGNVFVLNGQGSKLGDELKKYGIDAELGELPAIKSGIQLYWIPNPSTLKSFAKGNAKNNLRLSLEVMLYHNEPTTGLVGIGNYYIVDDCNNVKPFGSNGSNGSSVEMKDFVYSWADKAVEGSEFFEEDCKDTGVWFDEEAKENETSTPHWNPYRWMYNENDFWLNGEDLDGAWGYAPKVKMEINANFLNSGGAIIFRNVKFSEVKDEGLDGLNHRITWNWYDLGASAGVENVTVADTDAPAEYFNLQGVRVNNPANGVFICRQGNKVTKVVK